MFADGPVLLFSRWRRGRKIHRLRCASGAWPHGGAKTCWWPCCWRCRRSPAAANFAGPGHLSRQGRFRGSSARPSLSRPRSLSKGQAPRPGSAPPSADGAAAPRQQSPGRSQRDVFAGDQQALGRPWPPPGPWSLLGRQLQVAAWPWGIGAPAGRVGPHRSALPAQGAPRLAPADHSPHRRRWDRQAGERPLRTGQQSPRLAITGMRQGPASTAAIAPQSASPLKPCSRGAARAGSRAWHQAFSKGQGKPSGRRLLRTQPARVFDREPESAPAPLTAATIPLGPAPIAQARPTAAPLGGRILAPGQPMFDVDPGRHRPASARAPLRPSPPDGGIKDLHRDRAGFRPAKSSNSLRRHGRAPGPGGVNHLG